MAMTLMRMQTLAIQHADDSMRVGMVRGMVMQALDRHHHAERTERQQGNNPM